jgi:hypothetical protein
LRSERHSVSPPKYANEIQISSPPPLITNVTFLYRFVPTAWSFIAGVIAVVGVVSLGVASVVGVCLLLMLKSQERVCLPYRPSVVMRLVLCTVSGKQIHQQLSSLGFFTLQSRNLNNKISGYFHVSRPTANAFTWPNEHC